MPRLFLVRHAPTPETGSILTGRLPGVALGESGTQIAKQAAADFTGAKIQAVITSPVQRCRETAGEIGTVVGLKPRTMREFEEVDYGDWAGRKLKDLYKLKAWRHLHSAPSRVRFPGGESLAEAQSRAIKGCEKIASTARAKDKVVVVSHSDMIKSIVSHYLGAPQDLFQRIQISPASISIIDLPNQGPPAVMAVNVRSNIGDLLK
jgi:probable phosphoglycerate mutase